MKRMSKTIIAMRGRPLSPKKTEYGEQIRKAYEVEIWQPRSMIQKLEPRYDGICNTTTTVTKDNLILGKVVRMEEKREEFEEDERWDKTEDEPEQEETPEEEKTIEDYLYTAKDGEQYGIFKLSPRECLRLMDVRDEDIDKMLSVNSRSQCYKQAGNSIVVSVLAAIFSQLNIQGITPWNERNHKERLDLLGFKHENGEADG